MIVGIGTDIVAVARMAEFFRRHGDRGLEKLLAAAEREDCRRSPDPARFLAKRFAAKEALGKALGSGIRAPALLPNIAIEHDEAGRPLFRFAPELDELIGGRGMRAHLSLSDERDYAVAFAVLESS